MKYFYIDSEGNKKRYRGKVNNVDNSLIGTIVSRKQDKYVAELTKESDSIVEDKEVAYLVWKDKYGNENNVGQQRHYAEVFAEYKKETKTVSANLTKSESKDIRKEVKDILASHSDEEIKANPEWLNLLTMYEGGGGLKEQDSTSAEALNAFYTPRNVVDAVWKLADAYAPNAKTVLEPSSGIGRFAENRPNNQFTLREIDEISARIATILHPEANVIQGSFQAQFYDSEGVVRNNNYEMPKYDLVIGNPPYGEYTGEWKGKGEGKEFNRYEEYFIAKGLDSLKDENSLMSNP